MADTSEYKAEVDALGKVLAAIAELSEAGQKFVLHTAAGRVGADGSLPAAPAGSQQFQAGGGGGGGSTITNPKHFMSEKKPGTDVEKVACLAFLLAHFKGTPHFKTGDITQMNTEAAQTAFSNTSQAVSNAEKCKYLANAGSRGAKQLTAFGEQVVGALPDREAVNAIQAASKSKRRKSKKSGKKAVNK